MTARGGFLGFTSGVWHVRANAAIRDSTARLEARLDRLQQHLGHVRPSVPAPGSALPGEEDAATVWRQEQARRVVVAHRYIPAKKMQRPSGGKNQ